MGTKRLPLGEAERRAKERSNKSNAISKAKIEASKLLGIYPNKKVLTEEQKLSNKIRVKEWRAKQRLLKPVRVKMTPEEYKASKLRSSRKQYEKKKKEKGDDYIKTYKPRTIKMEKILKSRPANRISEKVIKPVKHDISKQPICNIKADDTGKVKVQLNERTWIMAKPGYDINALRAKYLRM